MKVTETNNLKLPEIYQVGETYVTFLAGKNCVTINNVFSMVRGKIGGWEDKPCWLIRTRDHTPSKYIAQLGDEIVEVDSSMSFHQD